MSDGVDEGCWWLFVAEERQRRQASLFGCYRFAYGQVPVELDAAFFKAVQVTPQSECAVAVGGTSINESNPPVAQRVEAYDGVLHRLLAENVVPGTSFRIFRAAEKDKGDVFLPEQIDPRIVL